MTSLAWKLNRLRLMGGREIAWRVGQEIQARAAGWGVGLVRQAPEPANPRWGKSFLSLAPEGLDLAALRAAADRIAGGRWDVFALRGVQLGFPPVWNRDPKTGTRAPLTLGMAIDYRDERVAGDIKYLWEPARHLELVTLAAAARAFDDHRCADQARTLLESWFDQCPYPNGVHWTSSLELAMRLLNWSAAWHLLGGADSALFAGAPGAAFKRCWLDSIYRHCHFIAGRFSRHSSANNHLFGEYAGLYVAASTWCCWPDSARWLDVARAGLEREALEQNTADGVNREQAISYHHEVMTLMLLCQRVAQAGGGSFSAAYLERLERMAEFVASLMDVAGNVPTFGDADDAQMLGLAPEPGGSRYRSLLASCALLFGRADFKGKAERLDDWNRWLFGADGVRRWEAMRPAPMPPTTAFADGGYYILGSDFGTPREVRIVADCGPLGYLSIAAHGHADALSLTLSASGLELLVDPGTYAYHAQGFWRDYFRGTPAHNTVSVDGQDQSVSGGNFMWLHKAESRLLHFTHPAQGAQRFAATHDGYLRLRDPVRHTRQLDYDPARRALVVTDVLDCAAAHRIAVAWHFDERCTLHREGPVLVARRGERTLRLSCESHGLELVVHCGSTDPPCAWISRHFDEKEATHTAVWSGNIAGATLVETRIAIT